MAGDVVKARMPADLRTAIARLLSGSLANLLSTWDERRGLFPYSSRLVSGSIAHDYSHPSAVRYTLNGLLGLARASKHGYAPATGEVSAMFDIFRRQQRVSGIADTGMLALLAAELGDERELADAIRRVRGLAPAGVDLVMQELAWASWGATRAHRAGVGAASDLALDLGKRMRSELTTAIGLPRHSRRRFRRRIVSFGALTYYLRALHEFADAFEDESAERLFRRGVELTFALQGARGEWPWMIDAERGRTLDSYPHFAVHQDSMAMLFLLPALDRGLPGTEVAIERSLAWALGENELEMPMYAGDGASFLAYRSIERRERAPRPRRYVRSTLALGTGNTARAPRPSRLRLNDECRSYHLGWILFAWADRSERAGRP